MIEIQLHDEEQLKIIDVSPFAWIGWPAEIIGNLFGNIRELVTLATTGRCVVTTGGSIAEELIKKGGVDDYRRNEVLRYSRVTPVRRIRRFEDTEDFKRCLTK